MQLVNLPAERRIDPLRWQTSAKDVAREWLGLITNNGKLMGRG